MSSSKAAGKASVKFVKIGNGPYYSRQPDDGNTYYMGSDGHYHIVIRLTGIAASRLTPEDRNQFQAYMAQHNNTFNNRQNQPVEFERAIVTEEPHKSTALADPHGNVPHWDIQLTNVALQANDGSTHLLHFRPQDMAKNIFYDRAYTRKEVADMQNSKKLRMATKAKAKKDGGKKDDGKKGDGKK